MFLAVIVLLQNSLPCTENFQRYQKNFEKYMSMDNEEKTGSKEGPGTDGEGKTKTIASPVLMGNLSPINSLAKSNGINFQPPSVTNMLRNSSNREDEKK